MVEIWFALLCFTLIVFAVLDGWNIGAGIVHFGIARDAAERRAAVAALGPLWSWHEVWLIVAGGTLVLAFPRVLGVSFSGFYLALWLVLWALILRGVSVEVGGHLDDPLWESAWSFVFAASSLLLALLFGVAIGAVVRGVPLDARGSFSLPLFTDFRPDGHVGLLDWYTLSTAALTTALLAAHGAVYIGAQTQGMVQARCERWACAGWLAAAGLFLAVSVETWIVRPELFDGIRQRPAAWAACVLVAAGVGLLWSSRRALATGRGLAASSAILAGLLAAAAASVFPIMLRSTLAPAYSLTAHAGGTPARGLAIGLFWWPAAAALAFVYAFVVVSGYRGPRHATSIR
jgi:cytochrome d ubiquinol oxidase subunit II